MRACHWKAQSDQSDKWHHQSRTATFHWTNHEGWTMSHHFSCHEHRKQSPRQKGGHRKEDTGTHINLKDKKHTLTQVLSILSDWFPTVILLYIDLTPYILWKKEKWYQNHITKFFLRFVLQLTSPAKISLQYYLWLKHPWGQTDSVRTISCPFCEKLTFLQEI